MAYAVAISGLWALSQAAELSSIMLVVVAAVWLGCAFSLARHRLWAWWACFVAAGLCALAGVAVLSTLIHMALHPESEYWARMNQPGAIAIITGTMLLVPSTVLLIHLFFIRGAIRGRAKA